MLKLSDFLRAEEDVKSTPLTRLFVEEPVSLEVFIRDKAYLGENWYLSPIQEAAVRQIERVYLPETYPLMGEEFGGYWEEQFPTKNLLTLQWGKGSGKDHVCRIASLRVAYLLLCLKSPQNYFGMPEHDSIHMLNIAVNSAQAQRAFFNPLTNYVKRGWFKDKADAKRDTIEYEKNLSAISGHSDAESQEGLNLILGVADEIDAFKAQNEMVGLGNRAREASTSAESILKMLKGSASTRFPYSYKRVAISYPRYLGSTIQKQTDEAKADIKTYGDRNSIYFASGPYATWDVNPLRKGKEDFASDYRKNPDEAAAMYECRPTRATDSFFRNMTIFKQAVVRQDQPVTIDYKITSTYSEETKQTIRGWEPIYSFAEDFAPVMGANYAMHGDLAVTGDRAGVAMSHVLRWEEKTETVTSAEGVAFESTVVVPVIKNDFVIAFTADKTTLDENGEHMPREIQIRWARMLAFELISRGFNITRFTFDGFQSTDTMQILNSHGIESERVSADINNDVYQAAKDVASDSRLSMPFSQLLMNELEALSRVGKKLDHPPAGSKDLSDAFAASIVGAIAVGGEEDPEGTMVDVGENYFETGSIQDGFSDEELDFETSYYFGDASDLPIGMKEMGFHV